MVEKKEDLGNAIALNSSMVNSAQLIGPSIASILIAAMGERMCLLLNGISFLAVIISLLARKITPKKVKTLSIHGLERLKEGFSYSFSFAPIRSVLLLLALISLMGMPYILLMPIFANDILHGGPHTLSFFMGGSGAGALMGAFFLASRRSVVGLEKWIALAASIFGIGLITFSLSRIFWFSLLLMLLTGFGFMVQRASSSTVLQTVVDEDKRGRVMSLYITALRGIAPFSGLLAGGLASKIGAPNTLMIGASCILGSLLFVRKLPLLKEIIHPIYVRMGIVSEVVPGIHPATELTVPPKD